MNMYSLLIYNRQETVAVARQSVGGKKMSFEIAAEVHQNRSHKFANTSKKSNSLSWHGTFMVEEEEEGNGKVRIRLVVFLTVGRARKAIVWLIPGFVAEQKGLSIDVIMEMAGWTRARTFAALYDKPCVQTKPFSDTMSSWVRSELTALKWLTSSTSFCSRGSHLLRRFRLREKTW